MQRTEFLWDKGFIQDPFVPHRAREGNEEELLSSIFMMVNGFDAFIGDPAMPQTHILCAPRGHGKTSHLLQVKKSVLTRSARALVVELTDFNYILKDGLEHVTIYRYIEIIRKKVIEEINSQIHQHPAYLQKLEHSPYYDAFCTWLTCYSAEAAWQSRRHVREQDIIAHNQEANSYGPEIWLEKLAAFAKAAGFASVYVLVDGVDETAQTTLENNKSLDIMVKMLLPLLASQGLMHGRGFAFKFFIPTYLHTHMKEQHVCRLDCYNSFELTWTPTDLERILNMRLSYASEGGISSFLMLCDEECEEDFQAIIQAASFPYRLIEWLDKVINLHCTTVTDVDENISAETLQTVLQQVYSPSIMDIALTCTPTTEHTILATYIFEAIVSIPSSSPTSVTYTWKIDGQVVSSECRSSTSDTLAWKWDTPGTKTVTVTASNASSSKMTSMTLTITAPAGVLWRDETDTFYIGEQKVELHQEILHKLLVILYDQRGQKVLYDYLIKSIYNDQKNLDTDTKNLQRHKSRLCKKLETAYIFIESVRGGYRLSTQGIPKQPQ